jgi:ACS family hexuronate transporter-like MFS transporter
MPDPNLQTRFTRSQIFIAALPMLMIVLNYLDRQILSVLAPVMRAEIGLSQMQYASAVNAFLAAYAFMYLGSGMLLDRLGSRVGLALFVALWSLASGLHAAVAGFWSLAAFRFLLGMTEPGGWTGAVKTVSQRFAPVERGLASGIFAGGASMGAVIAVPLMAALSLRFGWRSTFLVVSAAGLLWVPPWLAVTRRPPEIPQPEEESIRSGVLRLLANRRTLAYVLTRFFGDSSGYFFLFWLPEYLVNHKNFSFALMGAMAWIPFLLQDLGSILGGYASGRLVERGWAPVTSRKILMSAAAAVVAFGTLFQRSPEPWLTIASVSISCFGVGVWPSNMHTVAPDAFSPRIVATVHGLAGSAGAVGGIVFNTLVGYFSSHSDYGSAFLTFSLLQPLGVCALWLWMREPWRGKTSKLSTLNS